MRTAATRPSAQPVAALLPTVLSLALVAAVWEA